MRWWLQHYKINIELFCNRKHLHIYPTIISFASSFFYTRTDEDNLILLGPLKSRVLINLIQPALEEDVR